MIVNLLRKFVREEVIKILVEVFPERKKGILTKTSTPGTQDPKLKNTTNQTNSPKKRRQYRRRPRKNQSTEG